MKRWIEIKCIIIHVDCTFNTPIAVSLHLPHSDINIQATPHGCTKPNLLGACGGLAYHGSRPGFPKLVNLFARPKLRIKRMESNLSTATVGSEPQAWPSAQDVRELCTRHSTGDTACMHYVDFYNVYRSRSRSRLAPREFLVTAKVGHIKQRHKSYLGSYHCELSLDSCSL